MLTLQIYDEFEPESGKSNHVTKTSLVSDALAACGLRLIADTIPLIAGHWCADGMVGVGLAGRNHACHKQCRPGAMVAAF